MDRDFPFDLTIDHIKAILMNVFIAGTNTTAATVIWVMSALMKNPKCLKKTQAEVRDLVGKKGFINEDDVQALTYLKGVVKETFRLHPTAPMLLPRETLRNSILQHSPIFPTGNTRRRLRNRARDEAESGLVRMSATWSHAGTSPTTIEPSATFSRTKNRSSSTCLNLECKTRLAATATALELSHQVVGRSTV